MPLPELELPPELVEPEVPPLEEEAPPVVLRAPVPVVPVDEVPVELEPVVLPELPDLTAFGLLVFWF